MSQPRRQWSFSLRLGAGKSGTPYFTLFLIAFFGYWPVSMGIFSLKNDAYVYFLPYRYQISEAISNGHFPFWSPYVYGGFPIHGDMQSGVWNPIVWIISIFKGYNMSVLHGETLLYIFLAGVGMYKLLAEFNLNRRTKFMVAVAYMFCGFMTDSGQFIVWMASAAFLPFVFTYYHRVLANPTLINAAKTGIALFFLFTAGYPSFLIYCGYILAAAFIIKTISAWRNKNIIRQYRSRFIVAHLVLLLVFLGLSAPAIISYIQLLPYYARGGGASLQNALSNPFDPFCSISYVVPLAVTKEHTLIHTNPVMRNAYLGIFMLVFFAAACWKKWDRTSQFILGVTVFSFLFSLGSVIPLREWCYRFLPLMDVFRHPASMRLFTTIGILLIAAWPLHEFFENPKRFNKHRLGFITLSLAIIIAALMTTSFAHTDFLPKAGGLFRNITSGNRAGLKAVLDSFTFNDYVIIQGLIQLAFLGLFFWFTWKPTERKLRFIPNLFLLNILLIAQLSIPFTFVTQVSPKAMNRIIKNSPDGFPAPALNQALPVYRLNDSTQNFEEALAGFYNKKPGIAEHVITPTILTAYDQFLSDSLLRNTVGRYGFAYCADAVVTAGSTLSLTDSSRHYIFMDGAAQPIGPVNNAGSSIKSFSPNSMTFSISNTGNTYFTVFQNYQPGWKVFVDEKEQPVLQANKSFLCVYVPAGTHTVRFVYRPVWVLAGMGVLLLSLAALLFLFFKRKKYDTVVISHAIQ
jgi:Bacterial membrane protein YfhO